MSNDKARATYTPNDPPHIHKGWDDTPNPPEYPPMPAGYAMPPGYAAPVQQVVIQNQHDKPLHHGLHLFLTIITGGLWLPVWIIKAVARR